MKKFIWLIVAIMPWVASAQITDRLFVDQHKISTTEQNGYDRIAFGNNYLDELGKPELPIVEHSFVIPRQATVTNLNVTESNYNQLAGSYRIYPVQPSDKNDNQILIKSDSLYNSLTEFPGKTALLSYDGIIQGYHVITIRYYPLAYIPGKNELYTRDITVTVEYTMGTSIPEEAPISYYRANLARQFVKSMVQNPSDVDRYSDVFRVIPQNSNLNQSPEDGRNRSVNIMEETVPDYIIITSYGLSQNFQKLADWKTKKGIPTIIKLTEEIDIEYPGGDLQEKMRNYLMDIKKRWNGASMFILFGGDTNIVPTRTYNGIEGTKQVTDAYFVADSVWWLPQYYNIIISNSKIPFYYGRIPVKNEKQADNLIRKIISYEKAQETDVDYSYFNNSLIADAFMKIDKNSKLTDGYMEILYSYCQGKQNNFWYMFDHTNCTNDDHIGNTIFPTSNRIELNRNNLLSILKNDRKSINQRFHFVYHMDHSTTETLGSSQTDKGESITINDIEANPFAPKYYQVIMSGSCHPADFGRDCIAEHLLNKEDAGAVAIIGNSDVGKFKEVYQLDSLYKSLYPEAASTYGQFSLGYLHANALGNGNEDIYRLHLLGDPETPLWTSKPLELKVNISPQNLDNSTTDIAVSVSNIPRNQQAMICLRKGDEGYATRIIDKNGTYHFTFTPVTSGMIDVTVTCHNFRPYETQIPVNTGVNSAVHISEVTFEDSNSDNSKGNSDGRLDAGEKINMSIKIKNDGTMPIQVSSAILSCQSKYVKLLDNFISFGTLVPGEIKTSIFPVRFVISNDIGGTQILKNDPNATRFTLRMSDLNGISYVDTFKIDIYASELQLREQEVTGTLTPGSRNGLYVTLMNVGKSYTGKLTATLTSERFPSTIEDFPVNTAVYESISPKASQKNTTQFIFRTSNRYGAKDTSLKMTLEVKNEYGKTWRFSIDPNDKGKIIPIYSFNCNSYENAIDIYWAQSSDYSTKYNIYRSTNGIDGYYEKQNLFPLTMSYYRDEWVMQGQICYYKVAALSHSGNEGPATTPLKASLSFPMMKGFPKFMPDSRSINGSVCAADVDYDGKKELFYTQRNFNNGREAFLMGFKHSGAELFDIDGCPSSISGFEQLPTVTWATPAIGDLKGDGEQKIIAVTRNESGSAPNSIVCYAARDNNRDNCPDLIWKRQANNLFYRAAVLSNLDNSSDGSMEVVLRGDNSLPIQILDANGNLKYNIGGGDKYSMPAVADLDGDGDKEIIVGYDDGIYIWHHNGTSFGRNPVFAQRDLLCSSSPVVCDLDKDGIKEILFMAKKRISKDSVASYPIALKPDGTVLPGWNGTKVVYCSSATLSHELTVGDINRDGKPEVIILGINTLKVWSNTGIPLISRDIKLNKPNKMSAIIADVNGDSYPDILFGSDFGGIYAIDRSGNDLPGFPLQTEFPMICPVYVGDIDKDGYNEIAAVDKGNLYCWKSKGNPNAIEWGSERHDPCNTGEYAPICEPTLILSSQGWNGVTPCGNLIIQSGKFTISTGRHLTLDRTSKIIVRPGATLDIAGGTISNAYILALPGSTVTIRNNGKVYLRNKSSLEIQNGAKLDLQSGTVL